MTTFVSANEAARMLAVTKPTLYAYVSRGLLTRRTAVDGRSSLYARHEVEQLASRGRGRAQHRTPTIDVEVASAITQLQDDHVAYRGHDVAELARRCTLEQVAAMLWTGTLPAATPNWHVDRLDLATCRQVVAAAVPTTPVAALALAASALAGHHTGDTAPDAARRLIAVAPGLFGAPASGAIAARLARAWHRRPSPALIDAISRALVLLADHELATSTLAVRVACSVRADPYAAIAAGLHVVSGPLHGAAAAATSVVLADAERDGARSAVGTVLAGGNRLPGFGHTVYRNGDPRLAPLLDAVRALPDRRSRMQIVDAVLAEAGRRVGKHPNVDFGLAALTFVGELPHDAPLFAIARIAGWAAHYDEELGERPVRYRGLARARS